MSEGAYGWRKNKQIVGRQELDLKLSQQSLNVICMTVTKKVITNYVVDWFIATQYGFCIMELKKKEL